MISSQLSRSFIFAAAASVKGAAGKVPKVPSRRYCGNRVVQPLSREVLEAFSSMPRSQKSPVLCAKATRYLSTSPIPDADVFEEKIVHVKEIETHIAALESNFQQKQDLYANVGWETATEIDALFQDSKSHKERIKDALKSLKSLTSEARFVLEGTLAAGDKKAADSARERLDSLAKNLTHMEDIETTLEELETNYAQKQESYTNIGWETSDEIDALFADSKLKKDTIKDSVGELKAVIQGFTMS